MTLVIFADNPEKSTDQTAAQGNAAVTDTERELRPEASRGAKTCEVVSGAAWP